MMQRLKKSFKDFNRTTGTFIVTYHVGLAIGLPFYFYNRTPSLALVLWSLAVLFFTEICIGALYHRYYAHRCYEFARNWAGTAAETILLFGASAAKQGSGLWWSSGHRVHHAQVDTDEDPYSIKKGFFFAHMGWLLFGPAPQVDDKTVGDLTSDKLVMNQHRHRFVWMIGSNVIIWLFVGWLVSDFLGAFVLTWWTRLFVGHHLTWFVNSLAHTWGRRTFSTEESAVDNYVLAFLTVGEGYHNYHHTFPSDYRNGVRWYHFDPGKWAIWLMRLIGVAENLKRTEKHLIRRKLVRCDRTAMLMRLAASSHSARTEWHDRVIVLSDKLQEVLTRLSQLAHERREANRTRRAEIKVEWRLLKARHRRNWREWKHLVQSFSESFGALA